MYKTKSGTRYWVYGDKKSPVIIMIHGFRGTHHGASFIAKNLPEYQVIIPDLPGFGETPPLHSEHSLKNYIKWLDNFIKELKLPQKPFLFGHSFGSIIVSHFVAQNNNAISKLILASPISTSALKGPRVIETQIAILYFWLGNKLPEKLGTKLLSSRIIIRAMSALMAKTEDKKTRKFVRDQHFQHFSSFANRQVVYEAFLASTKNTVSSVAPKITVPTLIIAGDKDDIVSLKKQYELLALLPNAQITVINDVGHFIHYETPEQVADAIKAFLT